MWQFTVIVMTSSGMNTAMHTKKKSILAQAPFKIFSVYCVQRMTNWNVETSQCLIRTWLILTKLCLVKKFK